MKTNIWMRMRRQSGATENNENETGENQGFSNTVNWRSRSRRFLRLGNHVSRGRTTRESSCFATLIVRKVEGLWRLPFGGGVYEALCEGAAQCWGGFRRRCCCAFCCCFRADGLHEMSNRCDDEPNLSEKKVYEYTTVAGEGSLLITQNGRDMEEPRRARRGRSEDIGNKSRGGGPPARSPCSSGGGGGGSDEENGRIDAAAVVSSASRAPGNGHRSNAYGTVDGGGAALNGGAGREQPRTTATARRKRGGGIQILATSAENAAATAVKLAEELAKDADV